MTESEIIKTWLAPDDWVGEAQFDTPRSGPKPPTLREVGLGAVVGRTITTAHQYLGSYGMGGPGFAGFGLAATAMRPAEYLVLRFWAAAEWLLFDGRPVATNDRSPQQAYGAAEWADAVAGKSLLSARVEATWSVFEIGKPGGPDRPHRMEVPEETKRLPVYWGTGQRRRLGPGDSMWDAWVLSPSDDLFV